MGATELIMIRELTDRAQLPPSVTNELETELSQQGFFDGTAFRFVGIYLSRQADAVVVGFPKYFAAPSSPEARREILKEVSLICQVAAHAAQAMPSNPQFADQFHPIPSHLGSGTANPYDLAAFLLRDFVEHGLYTQRFRRIRQDSVGRRDWGRIMRKTRPVFERGPLYLRSISVQRGRRASEVITPLHAYAIAQCARLLQPLGLFQDLVPPEVAEEPQHLERYLPILRERMSETFSERELRLLRALQAWCSQSPYRRNRFGTVAPELLWEYAVKRYFGNISNTRGGRPLYHLRTGPSGYTTYTGAGEAIPDILYAARASDGRSGLAIFDAKYYTPVWDTAGSKVFGAPPNSDIAKQIGYFHSLRQLYGNPELRFSNAFLLPCPLEGAVYRYMGYVTCSQQQNREIADLLQTPLPAAGALDKVMLYQVDPSSVWRACLQNHHLSTAEVFEEFITRFNE